MSGRELTLIAEERAALEHRRRQSSCGRWYEVLDAVKDPEIPVLSIWDLGVLRDVQQSGATLTITITPTYSGCPAMEMIEKLIIEALEEAGAERVVVETSLAPAWSSEWMDAEARRTLREYGIAPPDSTACPQCGSERTVVVSEFGSTACKALYRCLDCREPFDHFKRF